MKNLLIRIVSGGNSLDTKSTIRGPSHLIVLEDDGQWLDSRRALMVALVASAVLLASAWIGFDRGKGARMDAKPFEFGANEANGLSSAFERCVETTDGDSSKYRLAPGCTHARPTDPDFGGIAGR